MAVKQAKQDDTCQIVAPNNNSLCQFTDYVVNWQYPLVSIGCLVTVNAIYWVVMPSTSTLTSAAIIGSIMMLVDLATYLQLYKPFQKQQQEDEGCSCRLVLRNLWSLPILEYHFPSTRNRLRALICLASLCGLFISSVLGLQLSTLIYIGASLYILSKPLRMSHPTEFPIIARAFDSVLALRPDTSSICSSPASSPSPDPMLLQNRPVSKNTSLVFQVDPMEMDVMLQDKPVAQQEQDELAPFLPSQTAVDEELISNPESTEDISASLLPSNSQMVTDSPLMSLRYQQDEIDFAHSDNENGSQEDLEEFELVDSTSESASLSNMPTS